MNPTGTNKIALIIPTLNEADNIVRLIQAYQSLQLPYTFHIIVADSNSPDGTADRVREQFSNDDDVTILNCDQRGRGASIVFAYRWLLKQPFTVHAIATSDADFSHDPKDFPSMVAALKNANVVIGSRYLAASKIVGWPIGRRIFSRSANTLARILLQVGIKDYTNGYRLFTLPALKKLDFKAIDADGYIHLSQELLQWHNQRLAIAEVPTTFVNRKRGHSNFRLKLVLESLWIIVRLWWNNQATTKKNSITNQ